MTEGNDQCNPTAATAHSDALTTEDEREARLLDLQYRRAFRTLLGLGPAVACFGSARVNDGPKYDIARESACRLAQQGFAIITGGGPGIMEAANRGAIEAGGISVGLNIILPHEQHGNKYQNCSLYFHDFEPRLRTFDKFAISGFLVFEGGWGTDWERDQILTLIQTGKRARLPVGLVGKDIGLPCLEAAKQAAAKGLISSSDVDLLTVLPDDAQVVSEFIASAWKSIAATMSPPVERSPRFLASLRPNSAIIALDEFHELCRSCGITLG